MESLTMTSRNLHRSNESRAPGFATALLPDMVFGSMVHRCDCKGEVKVEHLI